jgi:hypothetical protein
VAPSTSVVIQFMTTTISETAISGTSVQGYVWLLFYILLHHSLHPPVHTPLLHSILIFSNH